MTVEIDLSRLDRVAEVLETSVPEIVAGIVSNLTQGLEGLRGPLEGDDLERVAKAAHACRNEALLVTAQPLLRALTALEQAAREGRVEDARVARTALDEIWPETRQALTRATERAD